LVVCCWFNKSLKPSASIGPLLSRVIRHLIFPCCSPTPSAVSYFAQEQFDFQVFRLFRSCSSSVVADVWPS
jgi:hypothetical protein